jgi:signal transduction histidine kinase
MCALGLLVAVEARCQPREEAAVAPTVIAIYGFEFHTPTIAIMDEVLHGELVTRAASPAHFYSEFIDTARFAGPAHEAAFAGYLRGRYEGKRVDLLLAPDPNALRFLLKYRDAVFPRIPVVFLDVRAATLAELKLPPDFIGVPVDVGAEPTVRLALDLIPETRTLVILTGTAQLDRIWEGRLRAAVGKLAPSLEVRVLSGLAMDEIEGQLATLPARTVVLGGPFRQDGAGRTFSGVAELTGRWSELSQAPIFHTVNETLGTGVTGSVSVSPRTMALQAVDIARAILEGTPAAAVVLPPQLAPVPYVDWRQLQRWGIDEGRLPPTAVVLHREGSLWDRYRNQLIAVALLVALQAALIAALLWQRRRRHAMEARFAAQRVQLLHASRLAVAGELTASIAHEINQPLGAILSNADAADMLVQSGRLERDELLQILADIKRDDLRAGEVIKRLRALLARHDVDRQRFSLNQAVRDAVAILGSEARRRSATIESVLEARADDVVGDPVQIQQVVINLALNAFDASSGLPPDRRRVGVSTVDTPLGVELIVRDHGSGIAAADLPRLFDSFFTTKHAGMGLGLSLARSIVEAHGGTISAAGRDVGAEFCIMLPQAAPPAEMPQRGG